MNPIEKYQFCFNCHVEKGEFQACSRCKVAFYCSVNCQREHWKQHKKFCSQGKQKILFDILHQIKQGNIEKADLLLKQYAHDKKISAVFCRLVLKRMVSGHLIPYKFLITNYIMLRGFYPNNKLFFLTNVLSLFPELLPFLEADSKILEKLEDVDVSHYVIDIVIFFIRSCISDHDMRNFLRVIHGLPISMELFDSILDGIFVRKMILSIEELFSSEILQNMLSVEKLKKIFEVFSFSEDIIIGKIALEKKMALMFSEIKPEEFGRPVELQIGHSKYIELKARVALQKCENFVDYSNYDQKIIDCVTRYRFSRKYFSQLNYLEEFSDFNERSVGEAKCEILRMGLKLESKGIDVNAISVNLAKIKDDENVKSLLSKIVALLIFFEDRGFVSEICNQFQLFSLFERNSSKAFILEILIKMSFTLEVMFNIFHDSPEEEVEGRLSLDRSIIYSSFDLVNSIVCYSFEAREDIDEIGLYAKRYLSEQIKFFPGKRYFKRFVNHKPEGIDDSLPLLVKRFKDYFKSPSHLYRCLKVEIKKPCQTNLIPLLFARIPNTFVGICTRISDEDMFVAKGILGLRDADCTPRKIEYIMERVLYAQKNLFMVCGDHSFLFDTTGLMIKPPLLISLLKDFGIIKLK